MKTLLFCTGYSRDLNIWNSKYSTWLKAIKSGSVKYDHILIPDDASPMIPEWNNINFVRENESILIKNDNPTIYIFDNNLGRQALACYPGWFRSFMFSAKFARENSFEKIVHIEADSFVISSRMSEYINSMQEGWVTFWCPMYNFPETCIQVIAGNSLKNFYHWYDENYFLYMEKFKGRFAEHYLPFTHVNKEFYGNRWGEQNQMPPRNADFATQMSNPAHYWWLTSLTDLTRDSNRT